VEFQCRVATAGGQITEATYVAENEARLRSELEEKGLFLLSVQGKGALKVGGLQFRLPKRRKIPMSEFLVFNQELATLLRAGLPLVQSLDILRRRAPNPIFKAALDDIYDKVRSGTALSDAFEAQNLFSGVYTASLMAGEKSGSIETVLRRYVTHIKVMLAVRGQVISALIYPAVLILLSVAVVSMIVFKVVPEFAEFYKQYGEGALLPMSTRIVVAISETLLTWGPVILIAVVGGVGFILAWLRQPSARRRFHAATLRLPFFGPLARKLATAQVSRTLATLLAGGIPLVNALDISAKSVANRSIAEGLATVAKDVREGGSLGHALTKQNIFPHVAVEMVEVGESTGAMADMLNSVADFYDEENGTTLTRFSNLIQPILLVVMGVVIAFLLMSLYMPLFNLSSIKTS
jgi:type IV pilus assembly protein PilC